MSLQDRIAALITAIGADVKALTTSVAAKPNGVSAMLTATLANSTVTPAVLTGHTFTVPAGKTITLQAIMIFQTPVITTGGALGVRVAQGVGANASAVGSYTVEVAVGAAASNSGIRGGGNLNVAAGANQFGEVVGTGVSAPTTSHAAVLECVVKNLSTNANSTVTIEFRSEVAGSAVTAQVGSGAAGVIV